MVVSTAILQLQKSLTYLGLLCMAMVEVFAPSNFPSMNATNSTKTESTKLMLSMGLQMCVTKVQPMVW